MKKLWILVLSLLLTLTFLAGCAGDSGKTGSTGNVNNVEDVLQAQMDEADGNATQPETEAETQTTVTPPPAEEAPVDIYSTEGVDVDLSLLSGTMLYSQVSYMMYKPEEFIGKTVKLPGQFSVAYSEELDKNYYGCLVQDQSACCSLGVEFELPETMKYPEDYPAVNDNIVVFGTFDTYMEGEYQYCVLRNAQLLA